MFDDLKVKIDFEYKVFLELLKALSRTDIISRSYEISYKMALYRKLIDFISDGNVNEESSLYSTMMSSENALDQLYLSAKSKGLLSLDNGDIPDSIWDILINSVIF